MIFSERTFFQEKSPKRILIIGINYFPEKTGCGPYTYDIAKELNYLGHQVTVLTGFPHYPKWRIDKEFDGKFYTQASSDGIRILRVRSYIPSGMTAFKRILYEFTFFLHAVWRTRNLKPNLVLAISPSLLSIAVALRFKRQAQIKVLAQDLISSAVAQSGLRFNSHLYKLVSYLEFTLYKHVSSIAVACKAFVARLQTLGIDSSKISVSYNYSLYNEEINQAENLRQRFGWDESLKVVLYTGNMGLKQNLENLLEAAQIIESQFDNVRIVLVGSGSQKEKLLEKSKQIKNVEIHDLVSEYDYPKLLSSANLLLVHESESIKDMSISSKTSNYRWSRKPILVVCSSVSPTIEEVERYNLDHCESGNPSLLADSILRALEENRIVSHDTKIERDIRSKRMEWVLNEG